MHDASTTWRRLCIGNQRSYRPPPIPADRPAPDGPVAAVFRCADSDVDSATLFGHSSESLLDVSTWGHTLDSSVLATLEYAVQTRAVPLIVVLGHSDCQAMLAAKRAWEHADLPHDATRRTIERTLWSIVRRGATADSVESVTEAHVVETGLALIEQSPVIARSVDEKRCAIVCATTDPVHGRIRSHATIGAVEHTGETLTECV